MRSGYPTRPAGGLSVICDSENPGDAVGEAGNRIGIAGAAGRVEFADRQRSHPRISCGQHERLFGLAEGGPVLRSAVSSASGVSVKSRTSTPTRAAAHRSERSMTCYGSRSLARSKATAAAARAPISSS
jgi:hypothetical protein